MQREDGGVVVCGIMLVRGLAVVGGMGGCWCEAGIERRVLDGCYSCILVRGVG